jgi:hypothetical protein
MTSTAIATQKFKVKRSVSIAHIRPWIYLEGTLADGIFQCRVLQNGVELAKSQIPFNEINAVKTLQYAHGYIRFDFPALTLRRNQEDTETEYVIEFRMIGHTTSASNYLAMVREWDQKSSVLYGDGTADDNQASNDKIEPYGYQIFEYRGL